MKEVYWKQGQYGKIGNTELWQWAKENEEALIELAELVREHPGTAILKLWHEVFEPAPELSPAEYDIG